MNFCYLSRFKNDPNGHGGDKRAVQMFEKYREKGDVKFINVEEIQLPVVYTLGLFRNLRMEYWLDWFKLRLLALVNNFYGWDKDYYRKFIFERQRRFREALTRLNFSEDVTFLLDDPVYAIPAIKVLKKKGLKTIGLVHNLESQIRGQYRDKALALDHEIKCMASCDELITISKEDSRIISDQGVGDPEFIAYEAPSKIVGEMKKIALERRKTVKAGYLLLGSFFNPPTREGIFEFLEKYADEIKLLKEPVMVGGFGSSPYREQVEKLGARFIGELSKDELKSLYQSTCGTICYQTWGSGALTRISEYQHAEIPVFANEFARRSYSRQEEINEIDSLFKDHKAKADEATKN